MNNVEVEVHPSGVITVNNAKDNVSTALDSEEVTALRAYFQAERDEQLGLWHDPEDAHKVVYRVPGEDDGDGRAIGILDLRTGETECLWEHLSTDIGAADRYFAAHPPARELPTALGAIVEGNGLRMHLVAPGAEDGDAWVTTSGYWRSPSETLKVLGPDWKLVHEGMQSDE